MKFSTQENSKGEKLKVARIYPDSDQYNQFYAQIKPLVGKMERIFSNNKIEMPGQICSILCVYPPEGSVFVEIVFTPVKNLIINNGIKPTPRYVTTYLPSLMWTTERSDAILLSEEEAKMVMAIAAHQWNDPQIETVDPKEFMEKDDDAGSDN